MSRVPSPPPPAEMSSGPVAESWCYTQVGASWEDFGGQKESGFFSMLTFLLSLSHTCQIGKVHVIFPFLGFLRGI